MIKVLLVDDHQLFGEGVRSMFKPADGIEITRITTNGHQVPSILDEEKIDVILMDISMPNIDGIGAMQLMRQKGFDVPVLMLTMHQEMKYIRRTLEGGAQGYILKDASKQELTEAIQKVSRRENYFHPKINNQIFDYLRGDKGKEDVDLIGQLSDREKEIIGCIGKGMNSKAMADALFISEHTVKTHRRNIMHKLGVKNTAELVTFSMENGII
ncbi:MAG: DNA-binding NarL/FixJ family response regulator [Roseivirga sp.]|jgi:DNA-binding NarL/FixJ family response regulator